MILWVIGYFIGYIISVFISFKFDFWDSDILMVSMTGLLWPLIFVVGVLFSPFLIITYFIINLFEKIKDIDYD